MSTAAKLSVEKRYRAIRMCWDVLPRLADIPRFASLAVAENADNMAVGLDQAPAPGIVFPMRIAMITAKKWAVGRTLKVAFLDGDSSRKQMVQTVAPTWSQYANITFQFTNDPSTADIRVSFRQTGAWSYIGTDCLGIPKNQCTMNFGFIDEATILHEFGHALGCIHEHQHPQEQIPWNTDAVYRYYSGPPNFWNRQTIDSNIFQKYSSDITQFSTYDPTSIMHYPVDPALTDGHFQVGWNKALSAMDKAFVAAIYPKADTGGGGGITGGGTSGTVTLKGTGSYRLVDVTIDGVSRKAVLLD